VTTISSAETHVFYGSLGGLVQVYSSQIELDSPDPLDFASIYHNLFMVYQGVAPATQLSGKNVLEFKW